ncbi:MAG: gamma-glutamyltransferase, partial [Rhodospirillales bacterium]|nr:gamma-glutamyltransferase [Rhodospirillales bacterium]
HTGPIAQDIVKAVRSAPAHPGDMTPDDLAGYTARERPPVCGPYRTFMVCGMGPPSSGGIALLQMLAFLEPHDLSGMKPLSLPAVHLFAEAGKLAYADRGLYLADPDKVPVPVTGLLDRAYLAERAKLIDPAKAMVKAVPGTPPVKQGWLWGSDGKDVLTGTSHLSIIDAQGDAVGLTTTIEDGFGARQMVRGFLLNNELTDFAFQPVADGKPVANRVEGGKRPRSSMAPTMVLAKDGRLAMVAGSPGGSAIINYVAKTLTAVLDWQMDPQLASSLPNFGSRNGPTELEKGTTIEALAPDLEKLGHSVKALDLNSGIHAIVVTPYGLVGGADPRREGIALGR